MKQGTVILGIVLTLIALGWYLKYKRENVGIIDHVIDSTGDTVGEISEFFDDVYGAVTGYF